MTLDISIECYYALFVFSYCWRYAGCRYAEGWNHANTGGSFCSMTFCLQTWCLQTFCLQTIFITEHNWDTKHKRHTTWHSAFAFNGIMLSVAFCIVIVNVVMLNVIVSSVIMLSVMLSVEGRHHTNYGSSFAGITMC